VAAGWFHHFNAVTNSISLTRNFVRNVGLGFPARGAAVRMVCRDDPREMLLLPDCQF
jgi:hypothetical protein